jgi:hypothetical protein
MEYVTLRTSKGGTHLKCGIVLFSKTGEALVVSGDGDVDRAASEGLAAASARLSPTGNQCRNS